MLRLCPGARIVLRKNCKPSSCYNSYAGTVVSILNLERPAALEELARLTERFGEIEALYDNQHAVYGKLKTAVRGALAAHNQALSSPQSIVSDLRIEFSAAMKMASSSSDSCLLWHSTPRDLLLQVVQMHLAHVAVVQFDRCPGRAFFALPFLMAAGKSVLTKTRDDHGNRRYVSKLTSHVEVFNLPICLSYASTVHRAQGLTLTHVQAALHKIFEYGQA